MFPRTSQKASNEPVSYQSTIDAASYAAYTPTITLASGARERGTSQPAHTAPGGVTVMTRHGRVVRVRHIRPSDDILLVDLFQRLSVVTRRMRFMTMREAVAPDELRRTSRRLAAIDQRHEAALVASVDEQGTERIVGVARLVAMPETPHTAEFALVIRDDYQREGLGRELLDLLIQVALVRGIRRLVGLALLENVGIQRLVRSLGLPVALRSSRGETTMTLTLADEP